MIKIINLIENLDDTYGGPAKSVPYMCKYLNDIDIDTEVLSIRYHENEVNSLVNKYGLNWKSFKYNFIKKLRYSKELRKYLDTNLKDNKDLILHTHNLWNYIPIVAFKVSKKYNVPLVSSIRGSVIQDKIQKRIVWKIFQKQILDYSNVIHVTKKEDLLFLRKQNIKTPIVLISNGVEFDEFKNLKNKQKSKTNLNLDLNKKYILFISRLHPKKGLEYLVNAWIKLALKYKEWDLLIVGPEYNKFYVQSIKISIKKAKLENRVIFKGMLKGQDRIDAFGASDLFVLPSHTENFGIAIAEAMAAKLPVITTYGTPWQEIEKYDAGWWVELNQENIDRTLEEALNCSDEELKQKGLNGYNLIQKYKWEYQAKKMKQVYEWILGYANKPEFVYECGDKNWN
jgi:glycosyltransferase involved in cell wall biosynthesis